MAMSMEREAEVLEMPTHGNTDVAHARRIAQGRAAVERYVERLENATERLKIGPEASELYCALAELREGMIENDPQQVENFYHKALESFKLSHSANRGLRRLARSNHNIDEITASLEREIATATDKRSLQLELARTWLYCAKDAEKAIAILEMLENADSDASTLVPESEAPFDAETFLLWEDALLATGAWDRYEGKLRQALRQLRDTGSITQHIEERLWILYRYIMPDEDQASMLCRHLTSLQPLDDELVADELQRSQITDNRDDVVSILNRALERLEGSPRSHYYRSLLVDVAQFQFDDREHAMELLESAKNESDLILLHQQICLLADCGRSDVLLDALARSLEFVYTPALKAEQLYQIACILRDEMEQEDAAIDVFNEANELCPTHEPTIEALAEYYESRHDWEHLAQLYEYEISYATEHQLADYTPEVLVALHERLAHLYEDRLHFALNAFNHYQAMLKVRADDIAALKGASRMSQNIGNWTELLQLYAAAEGCTQDTHEHIYLLERIAHIANIYLNDADTACTALEALRTIDPRHDTTTPSLARLYIKLKKWDALIALTDEEIEVTKNPEYKVTLLCRNAEISENELSNIPQAVLYYEKARAAVPACRMACAALERIYTLQKSWEKLVDLIKSEASLTSDTRLKCAHLRHMAEILDTELDCEEEAISVYENALRLNPSDAVSRQYLLKYYRTHENWEEVLRILNVELKSGGTLGETWLTHFWIGRIELYRLHDEARALESFGKAFTENPNDLTLLMTWLSLSQRTESPKDTIQRLQEALENVTDEQAHDEIELSIADLTLRNSHDPKSIESLITPYENSSKFKGRGARFLTTMLVAVNSSNGRWTSRLSLALQPRQPRELQRHALHASIVLDIPEEIRERTLDVLCQLQDLELARKIWASLSPAKRPDYNKLPAEILKHPSREGQDLRRWCAISRLLAGDTSDPTDRLLPDDRDDAISYRPDLELLAAYFERFENWDKLLQVLNVQEETLNQLETIQITLQKAWVLSKIRKPEEALAAVRKACAQCQFDNPMRLSLYDYLGNQNDWDFLQEQIRQHLMHSEDRLEKSMLWMRLAEINKAGLNNLVEAQRCLDNAYHEDPSRGEILCEISDTAEKIGELDIARRALDDYIQYHNPSLEEQLELEPRLLELHFKYPGGETTRMLNYFDELVTKTGRSRNCLIILAKANASAGDPKVAAELLLQIVNFPIQKDDIELWLILVDLFLDRLNEQKKGEKLLWELFKAFPKIEYVFERLDKLYHSPAERRIFVANIQQFVGESEAISKEPALIRKYLGFAAQILGSELGAWREAQELYSQALDASAEPAQDLVKNRAYARCRIPGEALSAYREFCDLLVSNPFQPDIYRAAFDICKRNDARDRERILRQLATVFIPDEGLGDDTNLRPKLMDSRVLNDEILLKHLTHPDLRPVQVLLHEAMPILNNCLRDIVPKRTSLGSEKLRSQSITNLFTMCMTAFGITSIKGLNNHDVTPVPIVLDDPDTYWISMESWETMKPEVQRHWAGYASGMLWTGISRLVWLESRELWQLLDGIYYLATGKSIGERNAYTIEASERINTSFSAFQRGIRRDVAKLIDEIGPENIPSHKAQSWIDGIYATADRAGLLFSGSLTASIPAILEAEGWNPNKTDVSYLSARFKHSVRLPQLIRFALSDDYLELRFHAGLSLQPSKISG